MNSRILDTTYINMTTDYFAIQNKAHGLVLDVGEQEAKEGTPVIVYPEHSRDQQMWFHDNDTGAIRNKVYEDLCLDINEKESLVLSGHGPDRVATKWNYNGEMNVFFNGTSADVKNGKVLEMGMDVSNQEQYIIFLGTINQKPTENQTWIKLQVYSSTSSFISYYYSPSYGRTNTGILAAMQKSLYSKEFDDIDHVGLENATNQQLPSTIGMGWKHSVSSCIETPTRLIKVDITYKGKGNSETTMLPNDAKKPDKSMPVYDKLIQLDKDEYVNSVDVYSSQSEVYALIFYTTKGRRLGKSKGKGNYHSAVPGKGFILGWIAGSCRKNLECIRFAWMRQIQNYRLDILSIDKTVQRKEVERIVTHSTNTSSLEMVETNNLSKDTSTSKSYSLSQGWNVGVQLSVNLTLAPGIEGGVSVSGGYNRNWTTGDNETEQTTLSQNYQVKLPSKSSIQATAVITEVLSTCNFQAHLIVNYATGDSVTARNVDGTYTEKSHEMNMMYQDVVLPTSEHLQAKH